MPTKAHHVLVFLFWVLIIAAPIASSLIVIAQFPTDTQIPMHWNAQHHVDRYGSPWEMFPSSLLMAVCEALLAITYVFSNKLFDKGLVHGVSRKATRPFICGTAVFMIVVWADNGKNHEHFIKGNRFTQVPRHREISEEMFEKIKKQAGLK